MGPKSSLCQVIIKNTSVVKDIAQSSSSTSINRSQSLLTTNRIPVVASSRSERARLESLLSDVWTRDILPFPGMSGRSRGEHLVRTSASSMIRKLSVASITSNFTKRSGSQPSLVSVHHSLDKDFDVTDTKSSPYIAGNQSSLNLQESHSVAGSEDEEAVPLQLSIADNDTLHNPEAAFNTPVYNGTSNENSPASTMRRLATLRIHRSFLNDGRRNITPPLRTSSVNSVRITRIPSGQNTPLDTREKENQFQPMHSRWPKTASLTAGLSTEGLRGMFR